MIEASVVNRRGINDFFRARKKGHYTEGALKVFFDANLDRKDCFYCDVEMVRGGNRLSNSLTCDHIISFDSYPLELGSPNNIQNVLACCSFCNSLKGDSDFFEFCDFVEGIVIPYLEEKEVPVENRFKHSKKLMQMKREFMAVEC